MFKRPLLFSSVVFISLWVFLHLCVGFIGLDWQWFWEWSKMDRAAALIIALTISTGAYFSKKFVP